MKSRATYIKVCIIVTVVIVAGVLGVGLLSHPTSTSNKPSSPLFDYIVVIVLENKGLNWTYGSSCVGNCTFITQVANTFSLAENYSGVAHRSGPNYLTMTSGGNYSYFPFNLDCKPQTGSCRIATENIIDRIESRGRTWKAYMEDYTGGGCTSTWNNNTINAYDFDHNPFLYYNDIYNDPSRCSHIINANPGREGYLALPTVLLSDLNDPSTTPNFMWLSPNDCNNGHQMCTVGSKNFTCTIVARCVSQSNEYLSLLVPQILNTTIFKTQNALLFITWDEGLTCSGIRSTYPTCIDKVPAIFVGPYVKRGFATNTSYSHYSFVKTMEVSWNFGSLTPLDDNATPMTIFFNSASPRSEAP